MAVRTTTFRIDLDDRVKNRLVEVKKQLLEVSGKAVRIVVDGHDRLDKAAKSAAELAKKAEEAGKKSEAAMKKVKKSAEDAERGFKSVQDVLQDGIPDALKKLDQRLVATTAKFAGVSKNTAAIGLAAGAAIGTAVASGLTIATIKAADLEERMIRINKMTGMDDASVPASERDAMTKDVRSLMKKTGQNLDAVAASYETAGSMGIGGELMKKGDYAGARKEISEFVDINLMAAEAFQMNTDMTSEALGNMANVYKTKTETVNGFLRSMASTVDAVADSTVAKESQIINALTSAGSAVAQFKKSSKLTTDTTALAAGFISTGQTGEYSGLIIRSLLNDLYKNEGGKISQVLMMSAQEYNKQVVDDPYKILDKLFAKYDKLTPIGKTKFAKQIGMDEVSGKAFQYYLDEKFKTSYAAGRETAGGAYEAADRLDKAFGKSMEGTWKKWDRFKQILVVIATIIGSIFLPGVNAVLTVLNAVLDPLSEVVAGMIEFAAAIPGAKLVATVVSLAALAGVIVALVTVVAPFVAGVLGLGGALTMAGAALAAASGAFMTVLSVVGAVAAGIVGLLGLPVTIALALGAALIWVAHKTGVLTKFLEAFGKTKIGGDIMALINWAKGGTVRADLSAKISAFGGKADKWLQGLWEKVDGPIFGILADLYDLYDTGVGYFKRFLDLLTWVYNFIQAAMKTLKDGFGITKLEANRAFRATGWNKSNDGKWTKDGVVQSTDPPDNVKRLWEAYENAPEGVFGISGLIVALDNLRYTIENLNVGNLIPDSIKNKAPEPVKEVASGALDIFKAAADNLFPGGEYDPLAVPKAAWDMLEELAESLGIIGGEDPEHKKTKGDRIAELVAMGVSFRDANAYAEHEGYASGARFGSRGIFSGIVDPTEEIIPQAITQRGPGPLSQLLAQIYDAPAGAGGAGGIRDIIVTAHVHVGNISNGVDLNEMANKVGSKIGYEVLNTVERHGGYLRGGSLYR